MHYLTMKKKKDVSCSPTLALKSTVLFEKKTQPHHYERLLWTVLVSCGLQGPRIVDVAPMNRGGYKTLLEACLSFMIWRV